MRGPIFGGTFGAVHQLSEGFGFEAGVAGEFSEVESGVAAGDLWVIGHR
jgi:hypothetical protein